MIVLRASIESTHIQEEKGTKGEEQEKEEELYGRERGYWAAIVANPPVSYYRC